MSDNKNNNEDLRKALQEQLEKFRKRDEKSSPKFSADDEEESGKKETDSSSEEKNHSAKKPEKENKEPMFDFDNIKNTFKGMNFGGAGKFLAFLPLVIILAILGIKNFYTVNESEEGVVTRFGALHQVTKPGLNWKVPFIDSVQIVNVRRVSESRIEGTILTKDENVVNVELTVQYRIADPAKYLYNVDEPIKTIQEATESALRYVVGHMNMDEVLTTGRSAVRADTRQQVEQILDRYQTGIEIVDVNFQYARPPEEVKEAFDDAIKAQEDEQRFIREAEAYQRSQMPIANGKAQQIIAEAEGYARSVVTQAQGQAAYFNNLYRAYQDNKEVFKQRYYLDTLAYIYGNTPKVIMENGATLNFLGLDRLLGPSTFTEKNSSTFSLLDPSKNTKDAKTVTTPLESTSSRPSTSNSTSNPNDDSKASRFQSAPSRFNSPK